ncbi:MAG: hypothetical protein LBB48_04380 [Treponema sp.]|nr:hypothetical protein [Treponema sp.]
MLSVTARKLDRDTMFNAAVINLETGDQEAGDSADYRSMEDGVRAAGTFFTGPPLFKPRYPPPCLNFSISNP